MLRNIMISLFITTGLLVAMGNIHAQTMAGGVTHACAIQNNGTVKCWGQNKYGQLGNNSTKDSLVPTLVSGLQGATVIGAGGRNTCALVPLLPEPGIKVSGSNVWCWGDYNKGQTGQGNYRAGNKPPHTKPVLVKGIPLLVYELDAQGKVVKKDGKSVIKEKIGVVKIDVGHEAVCAIFANNALRCWGGGDSGALGQGAKDRNMKTTPVAVPGIPQALSVSLGYYFGCAVTPQGQIKCWGGNSYGQLGNGTRNAAYSPTEVKNINNAKEVVVSGFSTCALLQDNTVQCWGGGSSGELGNGQFKLSAQPVLVSGLDNVQSLKSGEGLHYCALKTAGDMVCWGKAEWGQLSMTPKPDPKNPKAKAKLLNQARPIAPEKLTGKVKEIALGYGFSLARLEDGKLYAWGANDVGQLGDGTKTNQWYPVMTKE